MFSYANCESGNETKLISKRHMRIQSDTEYLNDSSALVMSLAETPMVFSSSIYGLCRCCCCWMVLVVLLMATRCSATPLDAAEVDDVRLADQYLTQFGYYQQPTDPQQPYDVYSTNNARELSNDLPQISQTQLADSDRSDAIRRLQSFFNLPLTGRLDEATRAVMKSPRCGVSDIMDDSAVNLVEKTRTKRYAYYKYSDGSPAKWERTQLTWGITRFSQQIPESKQRDVIRQALNVWAKYVPVQFVESRGQDEPDINIMFGSRRHGPYNDPEFDGTNMNENVLAHAWGPSRKTKGFSGDVHFDNDDNWSNTNTFLNVAVHELGHSMGLIHSKDETAIMFPVYRETAELSQDDINGIREVYGLSGRPKPVTPRPQPVTYRPFQTPRPNTRSPPYQTRRPEVTNRPRRPYYTNPPEVSTYPTDPTPEDVCSTIHVDALFEDPVSPSTYIVVTGGHVHRISSQGQLISSDVLSNAYPGVPAGIDVAFSLRSSGNIYFIKGNKLWTFNNNQPLPDSPRLWNSQTETPKFSVPLTDSRGFTRLILFGATTWWIFDEHGGNPRSTPLSSFVNNFPSDVMFAVRWTDNYVYAISPTSYVKIDQDKRQIIHEDPIPGVPDWLRALCNSANRSLTKASMTVLLMMTAIVNTFNFFTS